MANARRRCARSLTISRCVDGSATMRLERSRACGAEPWFHVRPGEGRRIILDAVPGVRRAIPQCNPYVSTWQTAQPNSEQRPSRPVLEGPIIPRPFAGGRPAARSCFPDSAFSGAIGQWPLSACTARGSSAANRPSAAPQLGFFTIRQTASRFRSSSRAAGFGDSNRASGSSTTQATRPIAGAAPPSGQAQRLRFGATLDLALPGRGLAGLRTDFATAVL